MDSLGNISLFNLKKIGYFAAGTIASLSVLPTLDWAADVARRADVAVVSGFHSKMECEVLDFLLRGKCGIICVLARKLYKEVPQKYREAYNAGRVLFVSDDKTSVNRASRRSCQLRNEFIASISDELVFSSLSPESSLYPLSQHKANVLKL